MYKQCTFLILHIYYYCDLNIRYEHLKYIKHIDAWWRICASVNFVDYYFSIGSGQSLLPVRRQSLTWTNADLALTIFVFF